MSENGGNYYFSYGKQDLRIEDDERNVLKTYKLKNMENWVGMTLVTLLQLLFVVISDENRSDTY